jgi:hypothetical protein
MQNGWHMYSNWIFVLIAVYLTGYQQPGRPGKGKCPLRDGVMKKMEFNSVMVGTEASNVDIVGKDSVVISATDGRVMEAYSLNYTDKIVQIQRDTTLYTYWDMDSCVVREGQMVKAGQVIGFSAKSKITFFVGNNRNRIFTNPAYYVDCTSEGGEK